MILYIKHIQIIRAFPWHDWVMVTFAENGKDDTVEDIMEQNNDRHF